MGLNYTKQIHRIVAFTYDDEHGNERWFSSSDKAALLCLGDHADNETGVCFPGYSLIAAETLFSRKAVERSIGVLRHIGFITATPPGERKTTTYKLDLKRIDALVMEQNETTPAKKPKRKGAFQKHGARKALKLEASKAVSDASTFTFDDDCPVCGEICQCTRPPANSDPCRECGLHVFDCECDELFVTGQRAVND
jgi:hypothetical protein